MEVPPYYQDLESQAHKYISSGEPVSFVGMSDCGKNYLFRHLVAETGLKNKIAKIPLELTGVNGDLEKTLSAFSLGLSLFSKVQGPLPTLEAALEIFRELSKKGNISLICNIGYGENLNEEFLKSLYKWRNLIGFPFTWVICANFGITQAPYRITLEFEKVINLRLVPILPLDELNCRFVLRVNQKRYGEITAEQSERIIGLSGGNPGLLKSLLFLALQQAVERWRDDEKTLSRLYRLVEELGPENIGILRSLNRGEKISVPKPLNFFGYVNEKKEIFSPLVAEYIQVLYDQRREPPLFEEMEIELTPSERKIFSVLTEKAGKIVTRDEIARSLWGDNWSERYSDWAIDQLIHSIREKLSKEKNIGKIKTKKGEGFCLYPLKI